MAIIVQTITFCLLLTIVQNVSSGDSTLTKCERENECLCKIDDSKSIDISSLIVDKNVEFLEDSDRKSNITYFFGGCKEFELYPSKLNINSTQNSTGSLIRYNATSNKFMVLGKRTDINFEISSDGTYYEIVYGKNVTGTVRMICNDFTTPFIKIIDVNLNLLAVSSPSVCIHMKESGISTGSLFFILLLVAILIYFVGGACLMYFIRGARGTEMIPHVDFWCKVPVYLKNGTIYILSGCRPTYVTTEETYDRI